MFGVWGGGFAAKLRQEIYGNVSIREVNIGGVAEILDSTILFHS